MMKTFLVNYFCAKITICATVPSIGYSIFCVGYGIYTREQSYNNTACLKMLFDKDSTIKCFNHELLPLDANIYIEHGSKSNYLL